MVVLLDDFHYRQFSVSHITRTISNLYKWNIRTIAFSFPYPSLEQYFNISLSLKRNPRMVTKKELKEKTKIWTGSYTYDTGPGFDEDHKHLQKLKETARYLSDRSGSRKKIDLRSLAEKSPYTLTVLEEAANILSPVLDHKISRTKAAIPSPSYAVQILKRDDMQWKKEHIVLEDF